MLFFSFFFFFYAQSRDAKDNNIIILVRRTWRRRRRRRRVKAFPSHFVVGGFVRPCAGSITGRRQRRPRSNLPSGFLLSLSTTHFVHGRIYRYGYYRFVRICFHSKLRTPGGGGKQKNPC